MRLLQAYGDIRVINIIQKDTESQHLSKSNHNTD